MIGNVVILTFYSDAFNEGTGFLLEHEAVELVDDISNDSRDVIISTAPTKYDYPSEGVDYHNYELSTFIFAPNSEYNPNAINNATYIRRGIEASCRADTAISYKFQIGNFTPPEPHWNLVNELVKRTALTTIV
jgi:hypothetical protein